MSEEKCFGTICRVCLQHDMPGNMVSLIDNSSESGLSPYGVGFEKLTSFVVRLHEYLPTNICYTCKKSLEDFSLFIFKSETSEKKLAKLMEFSLKQDLSGDMVKEVVSQYSVFNQKYPDDVNLCENKVKVKHESLSNVVIKQEVDHSDYNDSSDFLDESGAVPGFSDNVDTFLYSIEALIRNVGPKRKKKRSSKPSSSKKPKKDPNIPDDLTCTMCYRTLSNHGSYSQHIKRHRKFNYVCDQCGKRFPVNADLRQHQAYSHGIGATFECDQCSYKTAKRYELIEHIRLHTGERPFTCENCGMTFRTKAMHKSHMLSHGEKTVKCNYCPLKFYRKNDMRIHSNNIHHKSHIYPCKVCNAPYTMPKSLRKHMLVKHGIPRTLQGKLTRINRSEDGSFQMDSNTNLEFLNLCGSDGNATF